MKKKRSLFYLAGLILSMLMLSGCGKVTPQSLMEDAAKIMSEKPVIAANMTADIDLDMEILGNNMPIVLNADIDFEAMTEGNSMYMQAAVSMELNGEKQNINMEMYSVEEDGQTVKYSGSEGEWTKEISDSSVNISSEIKDSLTESAKDGTQSTLSDGKVNGQYEVVTSISGDVLLDLMAASSTDDMVSELGIDEDELRDSKMFCVFYFDQKSHELKQVVIDLKDFLSKLMPSADGQDSSLTSDTYMPSITVNACKIVVDMKDTDTTSIEVPNQVKEKAELTDPDDVDTESGLIPYEPEDEEDDDDDDYMSDALQDENGNYIIEENYSGRSVLVAPPKDSEYSFGSSSYVAFNSGDGYTTLTYHILGYESGDTYEEDNKDTSYMEDSEYYTEIEVSDTETIEIDGHEVSYFVMNYMFDGDCYCRDIYVWTETDDQAVVTLEIEYFSRTPASDESEAVVREAFSSIIFE